MIDTVVLSIPAENFIIRAPDAFTPSARGLFEPPFYAMGKRGYIECIFNGFDPNNTAYHPRITLSKRISHGGFSLKLKIELSLPKLLFGNNFNELVEEDFARVLELLHNELLCAGIEVHPDALRHAEITGIHYGKNILLESATAALVIRTLAQLYISRRLDAAHTDYRNNGHALRFHTNHYELTFYDKLKDLEQARISEHRALEQDNHIQLNLIPALRKQQLEVLRMECRLNTRKNIKQAMQRCNIQLNALTLENMFSKAVAQNIVCDFWHRYIKPSLDIVILSRCTPDALFTQLAMAGLKEPEILKCCGALWFIKQHSARELKQVLRPNGNTYRRIFAELCKAHISDTYLTDVFRTIEQRLTEFESIRSFTH